MVNDDMQKRSDGHFANAMSIMRDRHFTHVALSIPGKSASDVCYLPGHLVACDGRPKVPSDSVSMNEYTSTSQR